MSTTPLPQPPGAAGNPLPLLNPYPQVSIVPVFDGHQCVVIDDFMLEPGELVDFAARNHAAFAKGPGNYYPGPELPLGGAMAARIQDSFLLHARVPLKVRRVASMLSRLSLATQHPNQVLPGQRLPHRDTAGLPAGQEMAAMVLYLFKDERLGGTSFFRPRVPLAEITALLHELRRQERAGEVTTADVPSTFAIGSTRHFEKVLTIPPRYNRAIFYNGGLFHSGDLHSPELMVNDPRMGRLTVNAFFHVRMAMA